MSFNEKAGTFILTAVQAVNDVKRIVEERVKALMKEAMTPYDAELSHIRERLDALEKAVQPPAKPAPAKAAAAPRKAKKAPAKKAAPACAMPGCGKKSISKGLCKNHYYQFKRGSIVMDGAGYAFARDAGTPPEPPPPEAPKES